MRDKQNYFSVLVTQIQEKGFRVVCRKLIKISLKIVQLLILLLTFLLVTPVVLVIRVLKPFVFIRFGYFWGTRIGHWVFDVENYLVERRLGVRQDTNEKQPIKAFDLFFISSLDRSFSLQSAFNQVKPTNTFFFEMCSRQLRVRKWVSVLFFVNHWLPGGDSHEIVPAVRRVGSKDLKGLFQQTKPQLFFNNDENTNGYAFLEKIGQKKEDRFVCLNVRDPAYLNTDPLHKGKDWSYHNHRDSNIDTYEKAAIYLAEKGYWVFRMGKIVQNAFNAKHPRILDYANSDYRSDFLDIWLMANCFFCISNGTGLDEVPRIFRKPAVYVNYLGTKKLITYDNIINVPKHLVWKETNRRLTLSEHLIHSYGKSQKYEDAKVLIKNLSEEEILQAVLEIEARLNGNWKNSEEDNQLQNRFWEIYKTFPEYNKYHGVIHSEARIGSLFLREDPEWLN